MNAEQKQKVFAYLTELRDGGGINMWSCAPYLMQEFGVDKYQAKELFLQWIEQCRRVPV